MDCCFLNSQWTNTLATDSTSITCQCALVTCVLHVKTNVLPLYTRFCMQSRYIISCHRANELPLAPLAHVAWWSSAAREQNAVPGLWQHLDAVHSTAVHGIFVALQHVPVYIVHRVSEAVDKTVKQLPPCLCENVFVLMWHTCVPAVQGFACMLFKLWSCAALCALLVASIWISWASNCWSLGYVFRRQMTIKHKSGTAQVWPGRTCVLCFLNTSASWHRLTTLPVAFPFIPPLLHLSVIPHLRFANKTPPVFVPKAFLE